MKSACHAAMCSFNWADWDLFFAILVESVSVSDVLPSFCRVTVSDLHGTQVLSYDKKDGLTVCLDCNSRIRHTRNNNWIYNVR